MEANAPLCLRQIRAIPDLLRAPTIEDGCRRAGVSKAAVYLRLENESFREELRRQREQLTIIALIRLCIESDSRGRARQPSGEVDSDTIQFGKAKPGAKSGGGNNLRRHGEIRTDVFTGWGLTSRAMTYHSLICRW
jgi:hypothetical protein